MKLDNVRSEHFSYRISLKKLTGKNIADIEGYLVKEFGEVLFKIIELYFDDGTTMNVEGEHDFPYLCAYSTQPQPNFDDETLKQLYAED